MSALTSLADLAKLLMENPRFARMFGDTAAHTADDLPAVAYAARSGAYDAFDPSAGVGARAGTGAFFSSSPAVANSYLSGPGGNIVPAYLSMKTPAVFDAAGAHWSRLGKDVVANLPGKEGTTTLEKLLPDLDWGAGNADTNMLTRWARENGYDGAIFRNVVDRGPSLKYGTAEAFAPSDTYAVFKPEQVKSIWNRDWDSSDPKFARGGLAQVKETVYG